MKTKNGLNLLFMAALALCATACSKKGTDTAGGSTTVLPPSHPINGTSLSGYLNGTLLKNQTYHLTGNVFIKAGDTLLAQEGAVVLADLKTQHIGGMDTTVFYSIYISGTLITQGSQSNHVRFGTSALNPMWGTPQDVYWGGINCDSNARYINMQWTDISNTGGADSIGGNQFAFSVLGVRGEDNGGKFSSTTKVIVENCSFVNGYDDVMRLEGPIQVSVKGNVFKHEGVPDGDGINIKNGVTGDVAYNYCWSSANNSIKLNSAQSPAILTPQTRVNVYNNTIINGGWRKQGETSAGILVDANAIGNVYNNMILNCKYGLNIASGADLSNTRYDYNYLYSHVDTAVKNLYPAFAAGTVKPHDIVSTGVTVLDPLLVHEDWTLPALTDFTQTDQNDPHLQPSSPAVGKGNAAGTFTAGLGNTIDFLPGHDMGAYQTDGSGNKRTN